MSFWFATQSIQHRSKTNEVTSQDEKRQEKNQLVFLYKDRIG